MSDKFPAIGKAAPAFSLLNQDGEAISLKDFKGEKIVVLYFYPKAMTAGCTVQACGIRDNKRKFSSVDAVVLGVSPDAQKSLVKFCEKEALNFDLLSDPDHIESVARRLALLWGVEALLIERYASIDVLLYMTEQRMMQTGLVRSKDLIAFTTGMPVGSGGTNLLKIHQIP